MKQYALCLAERIKEMEELEISEPQIYFDVWKSMNGRYQQRMVKFYLFFFFFFFGGGILQGLVNFKYPLCHKMLFLQVPKDKYIYHGPLFTIGFEYLGASQIDPPVCNTLLFK